MAVNGNVLARVFELFDELQVLLAAQGKKAKQLLKDIREPIKCSLAYLADVFVTLNVLNRQLQGPDTTLILHTNAIKAFLGKLALWERKVERGNVGTLQRLTEVIGEEPRVEELQQEIKEHLSSFQEEFRNYFHEIDANENVQQLL